MRHPRGHEQDVTSCGQSGGISVLTRQFGSTSAEGGSQSGQEKSLQGVISILEHEDCIVDLKYYL